MRISLFPFLLPAFLALCFSCAPTVPPPETVPVPVPVPAPAPAPEAVSKGDTVTYQIAFGDLRERERFLSAFSDFLGERFAFKAHASGRYRTTVVILPESPDANNVPAGVASADTTGILWWPGDSSALPFYQDTAISPVTVPLGGKLRLYWPRSMLDYPLSALVTAPLLREDDVGYLTPLRVTERAITLELPEELLDGAGKRVTVLDFIENWTRLIREYPSEGLALFRWVDGVPEFLRGEEAIVRGFTAPDAKTIRIRFSRPDERALDRLRTSRTLPLSFGLGRYYLTARKGLVDSISVNRDAASPVPGHLDAWVIRRGGDGNALLSFSLGRYDALLLYRKADLDYARRTLLRNGVSSSLLTSDRYFIACALEDARARAFIRSRIDAEMMLRNAVKAEGELITGVVADTLPYLEPQEVIGNYAPISGEPMTILFRKDDPASKSIAEKLLADCARGGMPARLHAADVREYSAALAARRYGCAVGWLNERVAREEGEEARFAAAFFGGEVDERDRIRTNHEMPLFSVNWYLVARDTVGVEEGSVMGLYLKTEEANEE